MSDEQNTSSGDRRREETSQRDSSPNEVRSGDIEISAIRHIGRTLESDPEYNGVSSPGYSTPEAQIAAEAGSEDVDQRAMEQDGFDSLSGHTFESGPERLKTRLPGDTSSDPHSDVGPDNATNLQDRDDLPNSDKSNRA
jgi:hypothetical protein